MTLFWTTDLHLDRGSPASREACLAGLREHSRQTLLITGDISNASRLYADLDTLRSTSPIYLVLGNHDHYGSSVAKVRDAMIAFTERHPEVQWLPRAGVVQLASDAVLIGVDGWADGRHGDPLATPLVLNDDRLIAELAAQPSRRGRIEVRQILADADAARLEVLLERAVTTGVKRILVATHVPPFVEAIRPGSRSDHPDWYPLLVCGATGSVLRAFAASHEAITLEVLCGHTHATHQVRMAPNLMVTVGAPRQVIALS